jgi:hypothetical protein
MPIQDNPIPAFKDRTKTIDEVIHHLTAVCIFCVYKFFHKLCIFKDCDLEAITIN